MSIPFARRALQLCVNNANLSRPAPGQSLSHNAQYIRCITTSRPARATSTTNSYTPKTTANSNGNTTSKPAAATASSATSAAPRTSSTSSNTSAQRPTYPSKPATEAPPPTARSEAAKQPATQDLGQGLTDEPPLPDPNATSVDWSRTYHGLGNSKFSPEASQLLLAPVDAEDVEVKPDGILYLPEIKYRRILNRAFGPGAWGMAPRGESIVTAKLVTREYGLIVNGRLISVARGEQQYFDTDGIPTATEGCKSNALMRCCKDLGIASELWDPRWIRKFNAQYTKEVWVEHVVNKKKRKIVTRKDDTVRYPYQEVKK